MRRGQAGLEYIYIIGIVAAGLIGMIFYVSRSHQGNLRSQADQLSESQYAPGKTEIHNREDKTLKSENIYSATTTTIASEHPQGQINPDLQGDSSVVLPKPGDPGYSDDALQDALDKQGGILGQIGWGFADIYLLRDEWEATVADVEAVPQAEIVRTGSPWPWTTYLTLRCYEIYNPDTGEIQQLEKLIADLQVDKATELREWEERKPDESSSGVVSSETGNIKTDKTTNETLDDLL